MLLAGIVESWALFKFGHWLASDLIEKQRIEREAREAGRGW